MKSLNKLGVALLAALLTVSLCDVSQAGPRKGRKRDRQPVAPVQDVDLTGSVDRAGLHTIVVTDGEREVTSTEVTGGEVSASVVGGVIQLGAISLSGEGVSISIETDSAELRQSSRANGFRTSGTAIVSTDEGDLELAVKVRGKIHERDGVYTLRASVRGHAADDSDEASTTVTVVRAAISATADVPEEGDDEGDDGGDEGAL